METSIKKESLNPLLKERLFLPSGNAERRRTECIGRCGYWFIGIASSLEVSCLGCFLLAELFLTCVHVRDGFRLCLMVRRSKSSFEVSEIGTEVYSYQVG